MSAGHYTVRRMQRAELDVAVDWAAAEGWNPGLHDASAFHPADPDGFLVGSLDGLPVTSISVIAYDQAFGFLGFYLAHPAHRGRGYGLAIWKAGMAYLAARNVGLDGVVAQQDNYRRSGFVYAHGNQRYEGVGGGQYRGDGVVAAACVDFAQICAYDRLCFPAPREAFLRRWLSQPEAVAYAVPGSTGIQGYGLIRRCREGHKIGPLFADDAAIAGMLFEALAAHVPGEKLYLDVPLVNAGAVALAEASGMRPVFETARMYTAGAPDCDVQRNFGVTTFELG